MEARLATCTFLCVAKNNTSLVQPKRLGVVQSARVHHNTLFRGGMAQRSSNS